MLLQAVHIPRLYSDLPGQADGGRRYCSHVLNLLHDVERNCVLLVDGGNIMTGEMTRALHDWPSVNHRRYGLELIKELRKRNRLVKIDVGLEVETACDSPGCGAASAIARSQHPDAVLGPGTCRRCASLVQSGLELADVDDYPLTVFARSRCDAESIALADGQWDRAQFELRVWDPLFRYAKHVKIFDRYVGRHLQREDGFRLEVGPGYAQSLEWVFGRFVALSAGRGVRVFEVTCGLESSRLSPEDLVGAAGVLRRFAEGLSRKYGVEMAMYVKEESFDAQMPHARFILTDQLALSVERGFDLLKRDGRIRDVVITHLPNRAEIERRARALPDVLSSSPG